MTLARHLTRTAEVVLVVDDETSIRIVVIKALREAGFQVIAAASADEAVILLAARAAVDLILTDFRMPGSMNGLGLARLVRRSCSFPPPPTARCGLGVKGSSPSPAIWDQSSRR